MKHTLLILFLFPLTIYGQLTCDKVLRGRVFEVDTEDPLAFSTIRILNSDKGTIADENGYYEIKGICEEEIQIEFRFQGYKTIVHSHNFRTSDKDHFAYLALDETVLDGVIVEEKYVAHQLKTISERQLKVDRIESLGGNAANVLAKASGVNTLKTGQNIVKPIVHGLHSNRVLVINNGVRHINQAWGEDHGIEIDIAQVDRIQLIKGASTVRYGSDALGGVILFNSPRLRFKSELNGEVNTGFETNGRGYSGEVSLGAGYKSFAWRVGSSGAKFGDLHAPNYQLTNTGKEEFGFTGQVKWILPWIDVDVFVSRFNQELGILRSSFGEGLRDVQNAIEATEPNIVNPFSYDINNPRQEVIHDLAKLSASLFIGQQQVDLIYAFQKNTRREFDVRFESLLNKPVINLELASHSFEVNWDHPSESNWNGTFGLQMGSQDNNNIAGTDVIPFVPNFNILNIGLFGVESYTTNKTTYEVGLRYDYQNFDVRGRDRINRLYDDNVTYQNVTFTLGMSTKLSESFSIRSNIGSAWRAPNISELYAFGNHQNVVEFGLWRYEYFSANDSISTWSVLTNDQKEVKSERGIKWITSVNYEKNGWQAEIAPHFNWIENFFYRRPFGTTITQRGAFPYFIQDQTTAIYSGIDIDLKKNWNPTLNGEMRVSYVYARDIKNDENFVGIPPINLLLSLEKKVGNFSFKISPEYEFTQFLAPEVIPIAEFVSGNPIQRTQVNNFDFVKAPTGFFLLGASLGYEKNLLKLQLRGSNLLNTSYRRFTDNMRYYADDVGLNIGFYASHSF